MEKVDCFDIYEGITSQVYQMKEGEISKPFYSDNAYYIIKMEKIYEWKIGDYEQEKPQLIESLNKFFDDCVTFKTNEFNNFIKRANHYQTLSDNIDFFCKRAKNMTSRTDTLGLFTDKEKALPLSKNDVEEITIGVFLPKVIEFYWDSLIHERVVVMLLDYMNTKRLIKNKAMELKYNELPEQQENLKIWKTHFLKEHVIQKEILDQAKVSDDVLRSIYMKNKANFKLNKRITVREIFCKSQTLADKVYQLAKSGENFEQLEKQYNQNQETRTHGLLGPFEKGRNGILGETAFDGMSVGSISKPFRYRGGYSLFQVISIDPARYKSFQEVKDVLKSQFIEDYKNDFIAKWFHKVKEGYKIKLYEFS